MGVGGVGVRGGRGMGRLDAIVAINRLSECSTQVCPIVARGYREVNEATCLTAPYRTSSARCVHNHQMKLFQENHIHVKALKVDPPHLEMSLIGRTALRVMTRV